MYLVFVPVCVRVCQCIVRENRIVQQWLNPCQYVSQPSYSHVCTHPCLPHHRTISHDVSDHRASWTLFISRSHTTLAKSHDRGPTSCLWSDPVSQAKGAVCDKNSPVLDRQKNKIHTRKNKRFVLPRRRCHIGIVVVTSPSTGDRINPWCRLRVIYHGCMFLD